MQLSPGLLGHVVLKLETWCMSVSIETLSLHRIVLSLLLSIHQLSAKMKVFWTLAKVILLSRLQLGLSKNVTTASTHPSSRS